MSVSLSSKEISNITYDPITSNFITSGEGVEVSNEKVSNFFNISRFSNPIEEKLSDYQNIDTLRFEYNNLSKKYYISPTGLTVVSLQPSKETVEILIYTNMGFTNRIHYWEIICPISCMGLKFGIVKLTSDKKKTESELLVSFRTTTPRIVGIELDMEKRKMSFFLNGKPMIQKNCEVKEGTWYPAIKINGLENMAILNPYASKKSIPSTLIDIPYLREEAEICFRNYIFVGNAEKITFSNEEKFAESQIQTKVEKAYVPVDAEGKSLGYFLAIITEDQAKLKNAIPDKSILTSNEIIDIIMGIKPSNKDDTIFEILKSYENSMLFKLKSTLSKPIIESNQMCKPSKICAHYINETDSLLLLTENEIKEVRREGNNFLLDKLYVGGHPKNDESLIYLCLSKEDFKTIIEKTCWYRASSICTLFEICSLNDLFLAFRSPIENQNYYQICLQMKVAQYALTALLRIAISCYYSGGNDNLPENLSFILNKTIWPGTKDFIKKDNNMDKGKSKQECNPNCSIDSSIKLIHIFSKLMEQLWGISKSELFKADRIEKNNVSRTHTTIQRLSSLIGHLPNDPSLMDIANNGIYNASDKFSKYKYFLDPHIDLENLISMNSNQKNDIWKTIESQIKNKRLIEGRNNFNIPLEYSINSMPSSFHINKDKKLCKIDIQFFDNNSNFFLTQSSDGSINLWDTLIGLKRLLITNFKEIFEDKPVGSPEAKEIKKEAITKSDGDLFLTMFADLEEEEKEEELEEKKEAKKQDLQEINGVKPKQELIEQLHNMGFKIELIKQALIKTKNEGLDQAIDAIMELQKSTTTTQIPAPEEKKNIIILSWSCPSCTYINLEGKSTCEMCFAEAPKSAYLARSEKKVEKIDEKKIEVAKIPEVKKLEEDPSEVKRKERIKKIINSKLALSSFIYHKNCVSIPFTLIGVLTNESGSLLRIRQFKYIKKYISRFLVSRSQDQGTYSVLNDIWNREEENKNTFNKKVESLIEEKAYIDSFIPYFTSNSNTNDYLRLFREVELSSTLIEIYGIIGIDSLNDPKFIILGKNSNQFIEIVEVSLTALCNDEFKAIISRQICLAQKANFTKFLGVYKTNYLLCILDEQFIHFNMQTFELIIKSNIPNDIEKGKIFLINNSASLNPSLRVNLHKKKMKDSESFIAYIQNNKINIISFLEQKKLNEEKIEQLPKQLTLEDIIINPADITIEDLTGIERMMISQRIEFSSEKKSINPNPFSHTYLFEENINHFQTILSLPSPTVIGELVFKIHFNLDSKIEELKVEPILKSIANVENLSEVKDQTLPLGLITVSSLNSQTKEDSKGFHLPLLTHSYIGSQYNYQIQVSRMLSDNNEVFASNYPMPEFIFKHQGNMRFIPEKCIIKSESSSLHGGIPIGAGLIFSADFVSNFEGAEYDFATLEQYNVWRKKRSENSEPLKSNEPIGFFDMGNENKIIFDLDIARPCRFIKLKPTGIKSKVKNVTSFNSVPLEIKYFGIEGIEIDEDPFITLFSAPSITKSLGYKSGFGIVLEVKLEDKWVIIAEEKDIFVTDIETSKYPYEISVYDIVNKKNEIPNFSTLTGICYQIIRDSRFQSFYSNDYRLNIIKNDQNSKWNMYSATLEFFVPSPGDICLNSLKGLSFYTIRKWLSDPSEFHRLNSAILSILTSKNSSIQFKNLTVKILLKIIKKFPSLKDKIVESINLHDFIINNIGKASGSSQYMLDFIQVMSENQKFIEMIETELLKAIPFIVENNFSQNGFEIFLGIVEWMIPRNKQIFLNTIARTVFYLICPLIEKTLSNETINIRSRYEIDSFPFDNNLLFMSQNQGHSLKYFKGSKGLEPLKGKILLKWSNLCDEYIIDLYQFSKVDDIKLLFGSTPGYLFKLKITVFGYVQNESDDFKKIILYSNLYDDHIWNLLNETTIKESRLIENAEDRDSLSINNLDYTGRYLSIQVMLFKTTKGLANESEKTPDILIIPLIYGIPICDKKPILKLEKDLQCEDSSKLDVSSITLGRYNFEKAFNKSIGSIFYTLKSINAQQSSPSSKLLSAKENSDPLEKLQDELRNILRECKEKKIEKKVEIKNLIEKIEKSQFYEDPSNSKISLQYLITIGREYIKIIKNHFNEKLLCIFEDDKGLNLLNFATSLFKNFIAFNCGRSKSEALNFLKDVIIKNMTDQSWISFIFSTIERFLSQPSTNFSQNSIIEALNIISIPDGEILSFLLEVLGIKTDIDVTQSLRKQDEGSAQGDIKKFTTSVSILILALQSLRRVQIPEGENVHMGIMCDECGSDQRFIEGTRYKCGHCSNYNICSKEKCIKAHAQNFPDHMLIIIPSPLPYSPNLKEIRGFQYKPLLSPFDLDYTSKIHKGIDCECCFTKNIEDIRYLCGNCDDYNLCIKCFSNNKHNHPSTHVFIQIVTPIKVDDTKGTPKALIPLLDPSLYYIPTSHEEKPTLSLKRSYSLSVKGFEEKEYERLDYDQSLIAIYKIISWFCITKDFSMQQKIIQLKLSIELFLTLTRLSSLSTISLIFKNEARLQSLLIYILYMNEVNLISQIPQIINSIVNHNSLKILNNEKLSKMTTYNRYQYMEKIDSGLSSLYALGSSLQNLLKGLIECGTNPHIISTSLMNSIYENTSVWNDHLRLILEQFLIVISKINVIKKDYKPVSDEKKYSPSLARSHSTATTHSDKSQIISGTLSVDIVKNLLKLLKISNNKKEMGEQLGKLWGLVLKALSFVPLSQIQELKIFDSLIQSFLESPIETQQLVYSHILIITTNISKESTSTAAISRFILSLVMTTLKNCIGNSQEQVAYCICSGWLDILICGETPKNNNPDQVFAILEDMDTFEALKISSKLLIAWLNLGNTDGVGASTNEIIMRLEIMSDIFKVISTSKNSKGFISIVSLFKNNPQLLNTITPIISELIYWLVLNDKSGSMITPQSEMYCLISTFVRKIIGYVKESDDLVVASMKILVKYTEEFDTKIFRLCQSCSISFALACKLEERFNKILTEYLEQWVSTDKRASAFAFEAQGFDFLMNRISQAEQRLSKLSEKPKEIIQKPSNIPNFNESDIIIGINQELELGRKIGIKSEAPYSIDFSKKFELSSMNIEELAKGMELLNTSGGDNVSTLKSTDWTINKKGYRQKLYSKILTGNSKNEFSMTFKLSKYSEIIEIQIGIVNYWQGHPECHIEPFLVLVEGGLTLDSLTSICSLNKIKDDGFANHSVSVYGRLLESLNSQGDAKIDLSGMLEKRPLFRIKYLRITFKKGVISYIENSPLSVFAKKNKCYGINFISIMGYDVTNLGNYAAFILENQKQASLEMLSQNCLGSFPNTLEALSKRSDSIQRIKQSFDMLMLAFHQNKKIISNILIAIGSYNYEMGIWIISYIINNGVSKAQISIISKINSSSNVICLQAIRMLKEHIIKLLSKYLCSNPKPDDNINFIEYLIKAYIDSLNLTANTQPEECALEVTEDDIKTLLDITKLEILTTTTKDYIYRFLIHLIFPPYKYVNKTVDYIKVWNTYLTNNKYLKSLFLVANSRCSELFLKENNSLDDLTGLLLNTKPSETDLQIWVNILCNIYIREIGVKSKIGIKIFTYILEQLDKNIFLEYNNSAISKIVEIIKLLTAGNVENEKELALLILNSLEMISLKKNNGFVNNVLMPLLKMELTIPISILGYDCDLKKYLKKIQLPSLLTQIKFLIPSLNDKYLINLKKMIKTQCSLTNSYKHIINSNWIKIYEETNPSPNSFGSFICSITNVSPTLFLIHGTYDNEPCIFGGFTSSLIPLLPIENENYSVNIEFAKDNFLFLYTPTLTYHFTFLESEIFGSLCTDSSSNGGAILFGQEIMCISFSNSGDFSTYINDSPSGLQCLEQPDFPRLNKPFIFNRLEVWTGKHSKSNIVLKTSNPLKKTKPESHPWENSIYPFSFIRCNTIYNIPSCVNIHQLSHSILKSQYKIYHRGSETEIPRELELSKIFSDESTKNPSLSIIDLEYDIHEETKEIKENLYFPKLPVLDYFEEIGGVKKIISVTIKSLSLWDNKTVAEIWIQWLKELESFSSIPLFFKIFIKNKKCKDLIFALFSGIPESKAQSTESKNWETEQKEAVSFSYSTLAEVFKSSADEKTRKAAIENGHIERIVERLRMITGEKGRKREYNIEEKKEEAKKGEKKEETKSPGKKKKKGVGYDTNVGTVWKVDEYLKNRVAKNEQIKLLLDIFTSFFASRKWIPEDDLVESIIESCLLIYIENSLRSGSLVEMTKDFPVICSLLELVENLADNPKLVYLLMPLGNEYKPVQKQSIYELLKQLDNTAGIFLQCLIVDSKCTQNENNNSEQLAKLIKSTFEKVKICVENARFKDNESEKIKNALALPLKEAYVLLLQDLRFDYMNMKNEQGNYVHHYVSSLSGKGTSSPTKMIRIAQELADLSTCLPIQHTDAIFVRVDKERIDLMKAIIMGSAETPYAHGAFEYDIYLDNNYPNEPPKMNLTTTGNGAVRFNPNLYNCGKVCLSLLGTWRGNANENWDPKISTINQLLISTQTIVMSEYVYFNEPGFEGESGTPEGEKKNEGYSNIVRYCNIKFAMLGQIRNPSKGFETVIKRHFYLKKNEIMKEVNHWLDLASKNEATYVGLVGDHNNSWAKQFTEKDKYRKMLKDVISELEIELNKIPPPSGQDLKTTKKDTKKVQLQENIFASLPNIMPDLDDETKLARVLNINDDSVKDRWSRYIGAMGVEAVAKQAKSTVFISGAGPTGIEIAKNVVLAGCNKLTLQDHKSTSLFDLSGQFFSREADLHKNRAASCLQRLQQLNFYVNVEAITEELKPSEEIMLKMGMDKYTIVILTECDRNTEIAVNKFCRKYKIGFIAADCLGLLMRVFNDFGNEFIVNDKDGEIIPDILIGNISNEPKGLVKTLGTQRHNLETNDKIKITLVEGMVNKNGESLNGTEHIVTVVDPFSFRIGDTSNYSEYIRNGMARIIKQRVYIKNKSLEEVLQNPLDGIDKILEFIDFKKSSQIILCHLAFEGIKVFQEKFNRVPQPWDKNDAKEIMNICIEISKYLKYIIKKEDEEFMMRLIMISQGVLSPLCAFAGGMVAQEIIKYLTSKFVPINQIFYYNCIEFCPSYKKLMNNEFKPSKDRYDGLKICIGEEMLFKLGMARIFMVGVGAIGCELLKNYAMLGIGTRGSSKEGCIVITDPDHIETSNLNRQFLFREKHLRKPKSTTAASNVVAMNPQLKFKIYSRTDKVNETTSNIYSDDFFESITCVTNALDNIPARRYIDSRCVNTRTPLIESGTLGTKGHIQVIIPHKTESYSSQNDPEDNTQIPHCTLKMFPEEALHCIEWARDKFSTKFTQYPNMINNALSINNFKAVSSQEISSMKIALKMFSNKPSSFEDCITIARNKFEKYFNNDIKQLLNVYPLDFKNKNGTLFWSFPKRPPKEIIFNPNDILHSTFVGSYSCLLAKMFNIKLPENPRSEQTRLNIAEKAAKIQLKEFALSDSKAKEIAEQVNKEEDKKEENKENQENKKEEQDSKDLKTIDIESLQKKYDEYVEKLKSTGWKGDNLCFSDEFEKDNDNNQHIDLIFSMANLRTRNYKLDEMSWIDTKLKAGRIIPALATSTSCIAGLQTIELIKVIGRYQFEDYRNTFLNLALPACTLSEPGEAIKKEIIKGLSVTLWDRWEIKEEKEKPLKLGEMLKHIESKYNLYPKDVLRGNQAIYLSAVMDNKEKADEREKLLGQTLRELLEIDTESYVDLTVTMSSEKNGKILGNIPSIRVIFLILNEPKLIINYLLSESIWFNNSN